MIPEGQSVWVIGCGFLGAALADAYRAAGARVLTIDPVAPAEVCGSAAEPAVLRHALVQQVPQLVFCCTATRGGNVADYRRAYVQVVEALSGTLPAASRLVFCSSASVYAGGGGALVDELSPLYVRSARTGQLLAAEQTVLAAGGVVARLVPLYGPGRCELLRRYLAGAPCLPGPPERVLNYVHRDDAVAALQVLAQAESGVYNVCGESFARHAIYAAFKSALGLPVPAAESVPSVRGVSDMRVSAARLHALGWQPQHKLVDFATRKEVCP